MTTLPTAATGREAILDGALYSVVLTDQRTVCLYNKDASAEAKGLVFEAFVRCPAVFFLADDGEHVGRHSDDFVDALIAIAAERGSRSGLARQWLRTITQQSREAFRRVMQGGA